MTSHHHHHHCITTTGHTPSGALPPTTALVVRGMPSQRGPPRGAEGSTGPVAIKPQGGFPHNRRSAVPPEVLARPSDSLPSRDNSTPPTSPPECDCFVSQPVNARARVHMRASGWQAGQKSVQGTRTRTHTEAPHAGKVSLGPGYLSQPTGQYGLRQANADGGPRGHIWAGARPRLSKAGATQHHAVAPRGRLAQTPEKKQGGRPGHPAGGAPPILNRPTAVLTQPRRAPPVPVQARSRESKGAGTCRVRTVRRAREGAPQRHCAGDRLLWEQAGSAPGRARGPARYSLSRPPLSKTVCMKKNFRRGSVHRRSAHHARRQRPVCPAARPVASLQ